MAEKLLIETIGSIRKKEKLGFIEHDIMPNTCVIETLDPFPGYYGTPPDIVKPKSIFIMLEGEPSKDETIRKFNYIKTCFKKDVDICFASITSFTDTCFAIRVKGLDNYKSITDLQFCCIKEDIKLKKRKAKTLNTECLINSFKTFLLEEVQEGFYIDKAEENKGYFHIPCQLSWNRFEEITKNVKYNWNEQPFDAALGYIYRKDGIQDVIRIFSANISAKLLETIKEKYKQEITRI